MSWIERRTDAITVAVLLFLLLHLTVIFPRLINHDPPVFLELGYRLLDGEQLYVDYEENDLPAIHYLSAIPTAIAKTLNISPYLPFVLLVWGGSLVSIIYSGHLARRLGEPRAAALAQITMALYSLSFYLDYNWGQREHIFLILYMPWFFMRLNRYQGANFSLLTTVLIGICAGIGVSIKPHFVFVAVLPELYLLAKTRRFRLIFSWEVLGVALVALAHVLYFALQPEVWAAFQVLMSRLLAGYGAFGSPHLGELLIAILIFEARGRAVFFLILLGIGLIRFKQWRANLSVTTFALVFATLGGFLALATQGKGWSYHDLPFVWMGCLLTVWMIPFIFAPVKIRIPRNFQIGLLVIVVVIIGAKYVSSIQSLAERDNYSYALSGILEEHTVVNDWVLWIDDGMSPAYPMLMTMRRHNASRYAMASPIAAGYYNYQGIPYTDPNHIVPEYTQAYLDGIKADIQLHQPRLIFVRYDQCWAKCEGETVENYHDYLVNRGVIGEAALPDYELLVVEEGFYIYKRKTGE